MSFFNRFWRNSHWLERVLCVVAGASLAFFAGCLWGAQNSSVQSLPPLFQDLPAKQVSRGSGSSSTTGRVVVHVAGAVKKAGVLRLPAHMRVADAIHAAGGSTPQAALEAINLAAPLEDGQQVLVPTREQLKATSVTTMPSLVSASGDRDKASSQRAVLTQPINVNTAPLAELELLPGIGPALAERIIEHRARKGRFESINDLDQVKGLGAKKLEKLRPWVRF